MTPPSARFGLSLLCQTYRAMNLCWLSASDMVASCALARSIRSNWPAVAPGASCRLEALAEGAHSSVGGEEGKVLGFCSLMFAFRCLHFRTLNIPGHKMVFWFSRYLSGISWQHDVIPWLKKRTSGDENREWLIFLYCLTRSWANTVEMI